MTAGREALLRVTEIFHSLQGESRPAGLPTVFVRLTGCPLRCAWCDTEYAFHGGEKLAVDDIVEQVGRYDTRDICVTGGEPLAQPNCLSLLSELCDRGFVVSLETSGALDVSAVDSRVTIVMDLKPPGSGEQPRNLWQNLDVLKADDQLKFVIAIAPTMNGRATSWSSADWPRVSRFCSRRSGGRGSWRETWPNGSWRTGSACGSRFNCTRCCGAMRPATDSRAGAA